MKNIFKLAQGALLLHPRSRISAAGHVQLQRFSIRLHKIHADYCTLSDTQVGYSCIMLVIQAVGRQLLVLTPCVCYCAGEYIAGEQLMDRLRSLIALYRHAGIEPVLLLVRLASQVRGSLRRLPRLIPPPTI